MSLPAVSDMLEANAAGGPLLHEHWGDNVFLESVADADLTSLVEQAVVSVTRTFRTARQCMAPIEGRGVVAHWDPRLEMLVMHPATQMPHIVRTGLAQCLGLGAGLYRPPLGPFEGACAALDAAPIESSSGGAHRAASIYEDIDGGHHVDSLLGLRAIGAGSGPRLQPAVKSRFAAGRGAARRRSSHGNLDCVRWGLNVC